MHPVVSKTLDVPDRVYNAWKTRVQQIYPAEALVPYVATLDNLEIFTGRDVIWFIDNEAAAATLIRGASREEDVNQIAELTHLLWAAHGIRVWIEWVDSDSNCSDGLSRDGLDDPWCRERGVKPAIASPPAWESPASLLDAFEMRFNHHH